MTDVKILYIGADPIGGRSATGQTLGSMYAALRPEQVVQLCDPIAPGPVQGDVVRVPAAAAPMRSLTIGLARRLRAAKVPGLGVVNDGLNASTAGAATGWPTRLRSHLRAAADLGPLRLPRDTIAQLRARDPDVIHSVLGGARFMRLALAASRELDIPIVPHLMDDWPSTLYSSGELLGLARKVCLKLFAEVLDRSPRILTIGRAMAAEYGVRYGKDCIAVGNSVDPADYLAARSETSADEAHELVYVGGLYLGRAAMLRAVARALERVAEPWRLVVHAPARDVDLLGRDETGHLRVGRDLEPDEVPRRLRSATALLFVESLQPAIAAFTRLSVSTKVPQYLAARRPIVAVGPRGQASIGELTENASTALVVHGTSALDLAPLERFLVGSRQGGWREKGLADQFSSVAAQKRFVDALVGSARLAPSRPRAAIAPRSIA